MWLKIAGALALASSLHAAPLRAEALPDAAEPHADAIAPRLVALPNRVVLLVTSASAASPAADGGLPAEPLAHVSWSRTADLAGRPIDFARSLRRFARPGTGLLSLGGGALPSVMPVAAMAMTSGFGMREHPILGTRRAHLGVDLAAPNGTPIVATSDGIVSLADWRGGYGLSVALEHSGGVETRYGHMSRLNVAAGQSVKQGQVIGFVGSTGLSTGPHLHYEVRVNGTPVNPAALRQRR